MTALVTKSDWEIGWELRALNGAVRRRRIDLGYTQKQLAEKIGVHSNYVSQCETLRRRPPDKIRRAIARELGCDDQDVWPDWLESLTENKRIVYRKLTYSDYDQLRLATGKQLAALPSAELPPDEAIADADFKAFISSALAANFEFLSKSQRRVLECRYGLNGKRAMSLQETADEIGRSRERVRQIEAKALCKLRKNMGKKFAPWGSLTV